MFREGASYNNIMGSRECKHQLGHCHDDQTSGRRKIHTLVAHVILDDRNKLGVVSDGHIVDFDAQREQKDT